MSKPFGVATSIYDDGKHTCVIYHNTAVVKYNFKEIILNSDGWETVTTKKRMNQTANTFNLGFQVFQKNYIWYVDYKGQTIRFVDNMRLER